MFHAGFKEVADAVVEDLEPFLEPGAEVKIAGHSLGGAAAVIVAAKLKLRGHKIRKVRRTAVRVSSPGPPSFARCLLHEDPPIHSSLLGDNRVVACAWGCRKVFFHKRTDNRDGGAILQPSAKYVLETYPNRTRL